MVKSTEKQELDSLRDAAPEFWSGLRNLGLVDSVLETWVRCIGGCMEGTPPSCSEVRQRVWRELLRRLHLYKSVPSNCELLRIFMTVTEEVLFLYFTPLPKGPLRVEWCRARFTNLCAYIGILIHSFVPSTEQQDLAALRTSAEEFWSCLKNLNAVDSVLETWVSGIDLEPVSAPSCADIRTKIWTQLLRRLHLYKTVPSNCELLRLFSTVTEEVLNLHFTPEPDEESGSEVAPTEAEAERKSDPVERKGYLISFPSSLKRK
jgi:hypothetical protein